MILANPIYDVVFKLLLNDLEVAKEFISRIMGREILRLQPSSQEIPLKKVAHGGDTITLLRMDFSAVILDEAGRETQVLIEIQKAKLPGDISRFRNYLGEQYKKAQPSLLLVGEDAISSDSEKVHLPIFTIYLLNFKLETDLPALLRVQREYQNAVTEQALAGEVHDAFVESLTHDSFIVQIPKLSTDPKERLERAFALFNQKLAREDDRHKLYLEDGTELEDDDLIQKMTRILTKAIAETEIADQMEHEDILQEDIERSMRKLQSQISNLEKEKEEANRQKEEERRQKEEERRQKEDANRQKEEALSKLRSAYQGMLNSGMSSAHALEVLGLDDLP